jgi:glutamate N-acetyltransferase/amino-acid N-acetyltransferase
VSSGVTAPLGFRAAAVAAGIKPDRLDLALVVAEHAAAAAGVFTTNRAQAAPVVVSREHLGDGKARAIVINAGCANAGTGEAGLADAREMAAATARAVGCGPRDVVVASTGVIGVRLPMAKVRAGIEKAAAAASPAGGAEAARAILTTDTRPKEVRVQVPLAGGTVTIGAMAKGAGMIAPRMATLLAFFTTDAEAEPALLRPMLAEAVGESLNRITVDGDTSTNDCAILLANGATRVAVRGRGSDYVTFRNALVDTARQLANLLVRDGEGASRVASVTVEGARSVGDADQVARVVAESPLVKTALHGGDPNWGRILAAAGRSGVELDMSRVSIWIGDVWVAENGAARDYDEATAAAAMREDPVRFRIRVGDGPATGWMWTSDLSRGYVDINSHYRS